MHERANRPDESYLHAESTESLVLLSFKRAVDCKVMKLPAHDVEISVRIRSSIGRSKPSIMDQYKNHLVSQYTAWASVLVLDWEPRRTALVLYGIPKRKPLVMRRSNWF